MRTILCLAALSALAGSSLASLVKDPDEERVMISEHAKGIRLACYLNQTAVADGEELKGPISWNHDRMDIADDWVHVDEAGRSILHIKHDDADEGQITCDAGQHGQHSWKVDPHFKLVPLPKSQYVIEEEDVYLKCVLAEGSIGSDEGALTFKWTRHEEHDLANNTDLPTMEETEENEKHFQIIQPDGADNSTLKIENVVKSDRAVYRCVAELERNGNRGFMKSSTETLIRVKDKYSALYPFIGIVAEVVVLVLVIFMCERRKSSADADDDDDDKGPSSAAGGPSNGSSGNVRHRRT